jgi:hypothetical protein
MSKNLIVQYTENIGISKGYLLKCGIVLVGKLFPFGIEKEAAFSLPPPFRSVQLMKSISQYLGMGQHSLST